MTTEQHQLLARKREKYNETRPVNWTPMAMNTEQHRFGKIVSWPFRKLWNAFWLWLARAAFTDREMEL